MTERLDMQSKDLTQEKIRMIGELFPNCITESRERERTVLSVDFDALKQELSDCIVDGPKERYQFTWPGKSKAKLLANTPTTMTLRPCREESVDFDNTKNLYIEGDNLEVLKILHETYLGKVKMIYIDPPYNTGNDFVYNDDFSINSAEYDEVSGDYDGDNQRLVLNNSSNGRFHTDWINMIYPRLKISRDFLTDDGIIFISIDDHEVTNLKKICDEIFGEHNFIAEMVIDGTPKNDPLIISTSHEYCLVYVKEYNIAKTKEWGVSNPIYSKLIEIFDSNGSDYQNTMSELVQFYKDNNLLSDNISNYKYADDGGIYRKGPIDDPQGAGPKDNRINPRTGGFCATPTRGWSCTKTTWDEWVKSNLIEFPIDDSKLPSKKTYIEKNQLDVLRAYLKIQTRKDTDALKKLFDGKRVFLFPKPVAFIKNLIDACTSNGDIILDYFSGSGTTAHATMELNTTDLKNRNFIMIQLPEDLNDNLKNAAGNRSKQSLKDAIDFCNEHKVPASLTEIGKERIRRIGKVIKKDYENEALDVGFRVFKLDESNMKDVFYFPDEAKRVTLDDYVSNVKSDRTPEDLLFQVMLEHPPLDLSSNIDVEIIGDNTAFSVDGGYLVACFDESLSEDVITSIAKRDMKPAFAVFRDGSMTDDAMLSNIEQIFKTYSPGTKIRIL